MVNQTVDTYDVSVICESIHIIGESNKQVSVSHAMTIQSSTWLVDLCDISLASPIPAIVALLSESHRMIGRATPARNYTSRAPANSISNKFMQDLELGFFSVQ